MSRDFDELATFVASQVGQNAVAVGECMEHLRLSLTWTAHHLNSSGNEHCKLLIQGCYGTAVEAISLLSFGLVRPGILSLRAHYEHSLQFLYYRDHPVEWRSVLAFRTQPSLPSANKKYLRDFFPTYEARLKTLKSVAEREHEDCYAVLSGVAHGTAIHSISTATKPQELVENKDVVAVATNVFRDVSETISDINVACFESNWLSVPDLVRKNLVTRFGDKAPSSELKM